MATNRAIFNSVRDGMNASFKARIPKMDATNQKEIGMMLTSEQYTVDMNDWLGELVNRIGLVVLRDNIIKNKLGFLVYGTMEYGDAVEEIGVNVIKGEDYNFGTDGSSVDPFRIKNPDVKAIYHKVNSKRMYVVTIYPDRAKRAFLNEGGLQGLLNMIVSQLTKAASLDDYISTKNIMNEFINNPVVALNSNQKVTVTDVTDEASGKEFVNNVKNVVSDMTFPTSLYNQMGIVKMVEPSDLTIFVRKSLLNFIDVNVLSSAFHKDDLNFTPGGEPGKIRVVALDDFGGLTPYSATSAQLYPQYDTTTGATTGKYTATEGGTDVTAVASWKDPNEKVLAIIAENNFFMITRQLERADSIWNPRGLYWNNYLHRWSQYGYNGFANACILTTEATE